MVLYLRNWCHSVYGAFNSLTVLCTAELYAVGTCFVKRRVHNGETAQGCFVSFKYLTAFRTACCTACCTTCCCRLWGLLTFNSMNRLCAMAYRRMQLLDCSSWVTKLVHAESSSIARFASTQGHTSCKAELKPAKLVGGSCWSFAIGVARGSKCEHHEPRFPRLPFEKLPTELWPKSCFFAVPSPISSHLFLSLPASVRFL